jgi:hypothetical protein
MAIVESPEIHRYGRRYGRREPYQRVCPCHFPRLQILGSDRCGAVLTHSLRAGHRVSRVGEGDSRGAIGHCSELAKPLDDNLRQTVKG